MPVRTLVSSLGLLALVLSMVPVSSQSPAFYPDDPIAVRRRHVARRVEGRADRRFEYLRLRREHVREPGHPARRSRRGTSTPIGEVPDSSWFVNRIGQRTLSTAELVRGPDRFDSVSLDGWKVSGGKSSGLQPGFRMTDPSGQLYQIEFDPPSNPEMATGAEIIGTAFYHAFGYHTVDVYLAELDPAKIEIAPKARITDPLVGERRR